MFKSAKNLFGLRTHSPLAPSEDSFQELYESALPETPLPSLESEEPETIIGQNVTIKGVIAFARLLRVDGTFEGELESEGNLIVGTQGFVKANLDLKEAFIAGKVEGNITVRERLVLRGRAEIRGDITAPLLSIDEGVSIIGKVHVTAPEQFQEQPEEQF